MKKNKLDVSHENSLRIMKISQHENESPRLSAQAEAILEDVANHYSLSNDERSAAVEMKPYIIYLLEEYGNSRNVIRAIRASLQVSLVKDTCCKWHVGPALSLYKVMLERRLPTMIRAEILHDAFKIEFFPWADKKLKIVGNCISAWNSYHRRLGLSQTVTGQPQYGPAILTTFSDTATKIVASAKATNFLQSEKFIKFAAKYLPIRASAACGPNALSTMIIFFGVSYSMDFLWRNVAEPIFDSMLLDMTSTSTSTPSYYGHNITPRLIEQLIYQYAWHLPEHERKRYAQNTENDARSKQLLPPSNIVSRINIQHHSNLYFSGRPHIDHQVENGVDKSLTSSCSDKPDISKQMSSSTEMIKIKNDHVQKSSPMSFPVQQIGQFVINPIQLIALQNNEHESTSRFFSTPKEVGCEFPLGKTFNGSVSIEWSVLFGLFNMARRKYKYHRLSESEKIKFEITERAREFIESPCAHKANQLKILADRCFELYATDPRAQLQIKLLRYAVEQKNLDDLKGLLSNNMAHIQKLYKDYDCDFRFANKADPKHFEQFPYEADTHYDRSLLDYHAAHTTHGLIAIRKALQLLNAEMQQNPDEHRHFSAKIRAFEDLQFKLLLQQAVVTASESDIQALAEFQKTRIGKVFHEHDLNLQLAKAYQQLGKDQLAITEYNQFLEKTSNQDGANAYDARVQIRDLYIKNNHHEKALEQARKICDHICCAEDFYLLGDLFVKNGLNQAADQPFFVYIKSMGENHSQNPEHVFCAASHLGHAFKEKKPVQSFLYFKKCLSIKPSDENSLRECEALCLEQQKIPWGELYHLYENLSSLVPYAAVRYNELSAFLIHLNFCNQLDISASFSQLIIGIALSDLNMSKNSRKILSIMNASISMATRALLPRLRQKKIPHWISPKQFNLKGIGFNLAPALFHFLQAINIPGINHQNVHDYINPVVEGCDLLLSSMDLLPSLISAGACSAEALGKYSFADLNATSIHGIFTQQALDVTMVGFSTLSLAMHGHEFGCRLDRKPLPTSLEYHMVKNVVTITPVVVNLIPVASAAGKALGSTAIGAGIAKGGATALSGISTLAADPTGMIILIAGSYYVYVNVVDPAINWLHSVTTQRGQINALIYNADLLAKDKHLDQALLTAQEALKIDNKNIYTQDFCNILQWQKSLNEHQPETVIASVTERLAKSNSMDEQLRHSAFKLRFSAYAMVDNINQEQVRRAIGDYQKTLQHENNNEQQQTQNQMLGLIQRGSLNEAQNGNISGAHELLTECRKIKADFALAPLQEQIRVIDYQLDFNSGRYRDLIDKCSVQLKECPADVHAQRFAGLAHFELKNFKNSAQCFQGVIALDGEDVQATMALSKIARIEQDFKLAEKLAMTAERSAENNYEKFKKVSTPKTSDHKDLIDDHEAKLSAQKFQDAQNHRKVIQEEVTAIWAAAAGNTLGKTTVEAMTQLVQWGGRVLTSSHRRVMQENLILPFLPKAGMYAKPSNQFKQQSYVSPSHNVSYYLN